MPKVKVFPCTLLFFIGFDEALVHDFFTQHAACFFAKDIAAVASCLNDAQLTYAIASDDFSQELKACIALSKKYDYQLQIIVKQSIADNVTHHFSQKNKVYFTDCLDHCLINFEKTPGDFNQLSANFDLIGDVHGCFDELLLLVEKLGYQVTINYDQAQSPVFEIQCPTNSMLVFVGDLVDRGPKVLEVLLFVKTLVAQKKALLVLGNHDHKLLRYLNGEKVTINHGLEQSITSLDSLSAAQKEAIITFLSQTPYYLQLDQGRLVVAHAGIEQPMIGKYAGRIKSFCLYGKTDGRTDEFGLPIRLNWAETYSGGAQIIYGHTPVVVPLIENNTINLDTGCVFGGYLTAYRYQTNTFVNVRARQTYAVSRRPLLFD